MQSFLLLASALLAAGGASAQNSSTSACVTGQAVHMIIARASLEPAGTGIIGQVATQVQQQLPGSDLEAVDYPATLDNYPQSEAAGVAAMTTLATSYAARCPSSKLVLMGYSQGAQVTMDTLCGTDMTSFNKTQPISTDVASKVVAAVMMGDPSKATNETFLQGTSTKDGVFPRLSTAGCGSLTSKMASFCNSGDTFCDSGNSLQVHLSYVQNNGTAATSFVVAQAKGAAPAAAAVPSTSVVSAGARRRWLGFL